MQGLDAEAIKTALREIGVKPHRSFNANVEDICDAAREELGLDKATEDYRAFISFLEVVGLSAKVEKYKLYTLPEFYAAVMNGVKKAANGENANDYIKKMQTKSKLRHIFAELYNSYVFENDAEIDGNEDIKSE